jgi:thiol-disulfide isomerase/thioredoxin
MQRFALILLVIGNILATTDPGLPVAGTKHQVSLDPDTSANLGKADAVTLVYAFDYWGSKGSFFGGPRSLYKNVKNPDPGRAHRVEMSMVNGIWTAEIEVPDSVSLLSYYFQSGRKVDDNAKRTFVRYVVDASGQPVRSARFRNLDFMVMAEATPADQLAEAAAEIAAYPNNYVAYIPYWRMRLEAANSIEALEACHADFRSSFDDLRGNYGSSWGLNDMEFRTYRQLISKAGIIDPGLEAKFNGELQEFVASIPDSLKGPRMVMQLSYEKMKRIAAAVNDSLLGQPATDFSFITIQGDSMSLSDFKGKLVLLDFWGTWCGPCVAEIPNLKKAYTRYHRKGFEIISISSDKYDSPKDLERFKTFVSARAMSWYHVLDGNRAIHEQYAIIKWPSLYLIGRDGTVLRVDDGLRGRQLLKTIRAEI